MLYPFIFLTVLGGLVMRNTPSQSLDISYRLGEETKYLNSYTGTVAVLTNYYQTNVLKAHVYYRIEPDTGIPEIAAVHHSRAF